LGHMPIFAKVKLILRAGIFINGARGSVVG
jgi:hypothetical protein